MAKITIIHELPRCLGKTPPGWYNVKAEYLDGRIIEKVYHVQGGAHQAKYFFLLEHGRVRGNIEVTLVEEER